MEVQIESKKLKLTVSSIGAQMMSIKDGNNTEFLWQGDEKYWAERAPVLFPFVARLYNNCYICNGKTYSMNIHGFAHESEFTVESHDGSSAVFRLTDSEETRLVYPYRFNMHIMYNIRDSVIEITYKVLNLSDCEMHFGLGAHPGFNVPFNGGEFSDYYLKFSKPCTPNRIGFTKDVYLSSVDPEYRLEDNRFIPLSHEMFNDDAIILKNMAKSVTLCSKAGDESITVSYPGMNYLGIWHVPETDAPYICIEPWVSLPGREGIVEDFSCRSDLIHLMPEGEYTNTWNIEIN